MHKLFYTLSILILAIQANYSQSVSNDLKHLKRSVKKAWSINVESFESISEEYSVGTNNLLNGEVYPVRSGNKLYGYAYCGRVYSCREGGCSAEQPGVLSKEDYEFFDYIILFDDALKIELIRIFNYQATHGQEVCSPAWLKQFKGYDGTMNLEYGNEIDAISGATISAISIIVDIENVAQKLSELFENHLKITPEAGL